MMQSVFEGDYGYYHQLLFFQNYLYRIHMNIKHRMVDMGFIIYFFKQKGAFVFCTFEGGRRSK